MNLSRKAFIGQALAAGAFPFVPSGCRTFGKEKVRLACVGIGNQAWYDIQQFEKTGLVEIAALCDTDLGGEQSAPALAKYPGAPQFTDFRKMLDAMAGRIDAVAVMTPDHAHFPAAMAAIKAGLPVFVEKPLAHTFEECELLLKAAEKYGVVSQMDNMGHSGENYHQFKHYVSTGVIDSSRIRKVVAHMNFGRRWHKWNGKVAAFPSGERMPGGLDWDSWLATASYHDYSKDYVNGEWRSWYDFGNGCLGDWGAHLIDTVHEFCHLGLPREIRVSNMSGHNGFVFPMQDTLTFKFDDFDIEWYEGRDNLPDVPWNVVDANSGRGKSVPKSGAESLWTTKLQPGKEIYMSDGVVWKGGSHASPLSVVGHEKEPVPAYPENGSDHFANFLLAVMGREETRSPISVAAPLSEVFCLGCIAQRLNRSLKFDPAAKRFLGDDEANALLTGSKGTPRRGWEEFYVV